MQKVALGLSGGVDSTVAASLLHHAIGKNLHCIFVDNGLLRKNEFNEVLETYKKLSLNVQGVDAKQSFYKSLKGISDPELKRKAIGKTFIEVFEKEASKIKNARWSVLLPISIPVPIFQVKMSTRACSKITRAGISR